MRPYPGGGGRFDDNPSFADGFVAVKIAGNGFDTCKYGDIAFEKIADLSAYPERYEDACTTTKTNAWYYACYAGGVANIGPFYLYRIATTTGLIDAQLVPGYTYVSGTQVPKEAFTVTVTPDDPAQFPYVTANYNVQTIFGADGSVTARVISGDYHKDFLLVAGTPQSTAYFEYDPYVYNEILAEAMRQQAIIDAQLASETEVQPATETETQPAEKPEVPEEVQQLVDSVKIRANSRYVSQGTEVYATWLEGQAEEFRELGYDVKYAFYRSTEMHGEYVHMLTKDTSTYINTKGTIGQMYYYRIKLIVTDKDGNDVTEKTHVECMYGNRVFHGRN